MGVREACASCGSCGSEEGRGVGGKGGEEVGRAGGRARVARRGVVCGGSGDAQGVERGWCMAGGQLCLGASCSLKQVRRPSLELGPERRDDIRAALRREAKALDLAERHERRGMWRRIAEQASGAEGLSALERL